MTIPSHLARRVVKGAVRPASSSAARGQAAALVRPVPARLAAARPPIALLPPAASRLGGQPRATDRVAAGWRRHHEAVAHAYRSGAARHNQAASRVRHGLEQVADGSLGRAASADLGRLARAAEGPAEVVSRGVVAVRELLARRPRLNDLARAYQAVKDDPNSVRRWIKGLADWVPTL